MFLIRTFSACIFWRTHRDAPDQGHSVSACFGGHIEMLLIRVILCLHVLRTHRDALYQGHSVPSCFEDTSRCSWSGSFWACMFWRTHQYAPDEDHYVSACFGGHIEMFLVRVILCLHVLENTSRCSWWRSLCVCMFWRTHWDAPGQCHSVPARFGGHTEMIQIRVILCLHVLEDTLRCSWSGSFCAYMFWRHTEMLQIRVILCLHGLEDTPRCSRSGSFCACTFWRTHWDAPGQGHSVPTCFEDTLRCSRSASFCACMFWRTHWDAPDHGHSVPACFGGHTEMLQIRVILCLHVLEDTSRCSRSGSFCACMFWRTHWDAPDQGHSMPACFGGHTEMLQIRVILCLHVLEDTLRCSWWRSLCVCMFWRTHRDVPDQGHSVPACFGGHIWDAPDQGHSVPVCFGQISYTHRIGGNLKLLREWTNADRKGVKIAFLIAACCFRLPICNLKCCFNAYRSALLDSCDSLWLSPIRCDTVKPLCSNLRIHSPIFLWLFWGFCRAPAYIT